MSSTVQQESAFTAMKNALVSRDQFAFFRTTLAQLVDKIYTRAPHKLRIMLAEYEQLQRLLF